MNVEALLASPHWRWMPGMRAHIRGYIGADVPETRAQAIDADVWNLNRAAFEHLSPDLTDPATLGCLLALVREAWGDPRIYAWNPGDAWYVRGYDVAPNVYAETESSALIAALLAAPLSESK